MITIECDHDENGCGTRMDMHRHGHGFGAETHYECPKCHKEIKVEEL